MASRDILPTTRPQGPLGVFPITWHIAFPKGKPSHRGHTFEARTLSCLLRFPAEKIWPFHPRQWGQPDRVTTVFTMAGQGHGAAWDPAQGKDLLVSGCLALLCPHSTRRSTGRAVTHQRASKERASHGPEPTLSRFPGHARILNTHVSALGM